MAQKTIDHLNFYLPITPYKVEGISDTFNTLSVSVAYRKGQGFVTYYHPGWTTSWGGFGCIMVGDRNPLTSSRTTLAKLASRNNAKELTAMHEALKLAADAIRAHFDARKFDELLSFMGAVCYSGYTHDLQAQAETFLASINNDNNSSTIQNQETMATKNQTNNESANGVNNAIMQQYEDMKVKHPDAMLLFRCGDFYELYKQDAADASAILGITATKRNGMATAMFPHHALDQYLPKLIRAGKRVAICDQLDDPNTRKLVKRGSSETTTDNNSSTTNNDTTMAQNTTTNETATQVTNNADKAVVQPLSDHGTLVIGGCGLTPKKQEPIAEQPVEVSTPLPHREGQGGGSALPTVTLSTYTTKKGATAPQIIGFAGEDDPRWVRNKGKKCVSASYRRDLSGNKVYILLFGTKYMDAARAMADAYNTNDQAAWERAEAQAQATFTQAQADGKAAWEAKKAEWAEKKAAREAAKAATAAATPAKTYTEAEVAALMQRVIDKDPAAMEELNKMLEKAA